MVCTIGCGTDLLEVHCHDNKVTCWLAVFFYFISAFITTGLLLMKQNNESQASKEKEIEQATPNLPYRHDYNLHQIPSELMPKSPGFLRRERYETFPIIAFDDDTRSHRNLDGEALDASFSKHALAQDNATELPELRRQKTEVQFQPKRNSHSSSLKTDFIVQPLKRIVGLGKTAQVEFGVGGMCSSKPVVHESLLASAIVLVLIKLICRGFYFLFSIFRRKDTSPSLKETANNEAAFVLMMLIVIMMNKLKVHLIYVRNQELAGFYVRQCFTFCYVVMFLLYAWSCL